MIDMELGRLCGILEKLTLSGSQEDWGVLSQDLFHMFEFLRHRGGKIVLAEASARAVITALHPIVAAQYAASLGVLQERLAFADPLSLREVA
ncbi:MAG: hypothetical protein HYT41_02725 [Candidatus Sungbacteria bacterium]|nr:hypothetical protein [Candidatus Sungbacteria bacterium]